MGKETALPTYNEAYWNKLKAQYGLPQKGDINYFNNYYRFGVFDPYNEMQSGREFLFFVKPDLYITKGKGGNTLSSELENYPFFRDLKERWHNVILQLQSYADPNNIPFAYLLSNMVDSSLDLPSLSATTIQNPTNIYGISYDYRGTSESSDDNHSFSLEFRDTKNLDVYMFFRAYEEYQKLKAQGVINLNSDSHYKTYITNKVLHDQIGIYKFIVAEDMETIIHYSYFCGCMFMSLPRDAFNDANFDEGIKYGIDMKCAFVEDMDPSIISDFNYLVSNYNRNFTQDNIASIFDIENDKTDLLPVSSPFIVKGTLNGKKYYKLKWYRRR